VASTVKSDTYADTFPASFNPRFRLGT